MLFRSQPLCLRLRKSNQFYLPFFYTSQLFYYTMSRRQGKGIITREIIIGKNLPYCLEAYKPKAIFFTQKHTGTKLTSLFLNARTLQLVYSLYNAVKSFCLTTMSAETEAIYNNYNAVSLSLCFHSLQSC